MRSIGVKNINLVKRSTKEAVKDRHINYGTICYTGIEQEVIEQLPASLWDTWESADSEIRRIINDVMMEG